jgi:hypothetical protein
MKYQYKEMPESMSGTYGEFAKNFGFDWKEFIMGIPSAKTDGTLDDTMARKIIEIICGKPDITLDQLSAETGIARRFSGGFL